MANHVSHAAVPYPVKGCRFTLAVPYLDADGDPLDPTTPDTERSIDGAAFADCTEEVSTITGSNGTGYITLTGDELNGSLIAVAAKVASGPKNTLATLYPRVLPVVRSGTAQAGAAGTITLDSGASAIDDYYNGMIVRTTGGTGGGGGSGSLGNQARVITDYVGSTKVATTVPNWETTPDGTTTFEVLMTEMALLRYSDLQAWRGVQPSVLISGRIDANAQALANDVITATVIATNAIDADAIADNAIDAGAIAANAITSAKIATNAIGAAQIAAGAITSSQAPNLDAAITTRATPAQVKTQMVDALNVDTYAEPGQGAPAATTTLAAKIGYLFKFLRNRITQTSTTLKVFADDAVTVDQKATVSDDATTYDRGEIGTGP